jgi:hypothetical protein
MTLQLTDILDPLGSLLCPLTCAIAAGACALLRPDSAAAVLTKLLVNLTPQYLDREAYIALDVSVEEALSLDVEALCYSNTTLARSQRSTTVRTVIDCGSGVNVLAHLDPGKSAISVLTKAIVASEKTASPSTRIHIALVLTSHLNEVRIKIDQSGLTNVQICDPSSVQQHSKFAPMLIIGVTSTEEALLFLASWFVLRVP